MNLYSDVSQLKGVGPKLKEALAKCGIFNLLDLILYFPRDYENIGLNLDVEEINPEEKQVVECIAIEFTKDFRTKNNKLLSTIVFKYNDHIVKGIWFNQPYIKKTFVLGNKYLLMGKIKKYKTYMEIINPVVVSKEINESKVIAKYSLNNALTNKILVKLINQILDNLTIVENLPKDILEKYKFISFDEAIRNIHFPRDEQMLKEAIRRLKFQELLTYSIKILMLKKHFKEGSQGIAFKMCEDLVKLKESLPYPLTNAQNRVIREILMDQKKNQVMNRLVQGDVGSGKTIVAIIAMFNIVKNGYQAVMMAPTEILAKQHYIEVCKLLKDFEIDIEILTGSTSKKDRERILVKGVEGVPFIAIGTHALIEDNIIFNKLGIIITDEQHRFGVNQRSKLINKGITADTLVMSATPIPRTLSLYLYGDLDISIIDELPPGRKPIETIFYQESYRDLAYKLALEQLQQGRQVYIVCPLIEENEDLKLNSVEKIYEEIRSKYFEKYKIAMLHGKMNGKVKEEIMSEFKANTINVLISTTVIEVGVNVPNASVMIIENAERFGLSQLHQLRGRVGRGVHKSYCILVANAKNNITKKRMMTMTESNDGFFIAEQDMKLRGMGEIFGVKQHGDDGLILADLIEDIEILKVANYEGRKMINSEVPEHRMYCNNLYSNIVKTTRYICFN